VETIKSKQEFEKVFSRGRRYGHPLVRMTVFRVDEGMSDRAGKVAFVAAKRLGNAVFRNRCKRVLREAARSCDMPVEGTHIILFATHATHDSSPAEVSKAIRKLLNKARVA
jgi:ribonuclease P protein component